MAVLPTLLETEKGLLIYGRKKQALYIGMTSKPRTIDNLGMDASIRYAQDQKLFESRFIEESKLIPKRSEISVSKPYTPSEFDRLFSLESKAQLWASFSPPPGFVGEFANSLFSYQLIPSLHLDEEHADPEELLNAALEKRREQNPNSSDEEKQEEEEEKTLIANLLKCIAKIDSSLRLINSRRNQYQRG